MIYCQIPWKDDSLLLRSLRPSDAEPLAKYWAHMDSNQAKNLGIAKEQLPPREEMLSQFKKMASLTDHAYSDTWAIIGECKGQLAALGLAVDIVNGAHAEWQYYSINSFQHETHSLLGIEMLKLFSELYNLSHLCWYPSTSNSIAQAMMKEFGIPSASTTKREAQGLFSQGSFYEIELAAETIAQIKASLAA